MNELVPEDLNPSPCANEGSMGGHRMFQAIENGLPTRVAHGPSSDGRHFRRRVPLVLRPFQELRVPIVQLQVRLLRSFLEFELCLVSRTTREQGLEPLWYTFYEDPKGEL